ncbi:MAG: hypothetical protein ACLRMN_02245 [Mediterraneibacter gnavus]
MGRLIKYELKKQQTSRNIILALLLVFLLAVVVGTFTDNGNMVGISMGLEIFVGMFVFFYMGIESLLILNRDLKTKQSHMLWMVPMPSWKILGAKYIAADCCRFSVFQQRYVLAGTACVMTMIAKEGAWKELMQAIRMGFEWSLPGQPGLDNRSGNLAVFLPGMDICDRNRISGNYCIQNGIDQFQICRDCFFDPVLRDQRNCGVCL